jgi:hypothetical protein
MEAVTAFLEPLLFEYASKYPVLLTILIVMASFRIFFKPLMEIFKGVVDLTPSKKDDEFYAKMLDHKAYKTVAFLIDWFASIKLPKKE